MPSLIDRLQGEFYDGDMARGDIYHDSGRIKISKIGTGGVIARAQGSQSQSYRVEIDYWGAEYGEITAYCDCQRFEDGAFCKHLWALFRELENYPEIDLPEGCVLYGECEPSVDVGAPLRHGKRGKKLSAGPQWKQQLASTSVTRMSPSFAADPSSNRNAQRPTQLWFVIELSDLGRSRMPIRTYVSHIKTDGQWGARKKTLPNPNGFEGDIDPDDSHSYALLGKVPVSQGYYEPSSYALEFQTQILDETLRALCKNGRFGWSLESGQKLGEFYPVAYDDGGAWKFSIRVAKKNSQNVTVQPLLVRQREEDAPNEERNLEQIVGVCESGVVLFREQVGIIQPGSLTAISAWQKIGNLEVPLKELDDLLIEFSQHAACQNVQFDAQLKISSSETSAVPRLKLASPAERPDYLDAEVFLCIGDEEIPFGSDQQAVWNSTQRTFLQRDFEQEKRCREQLASLPFQEIKDYEIGAGLVSRVQIHRKHLVDAVTKLSGEGWEVVADGSRIRQPGNFDLRVESGEDWFDLHGDFKFDEKSGSLPEILKALHKGEKFIVLDDGSKGILPDEWLARFGKLTSAGETQDEGIRFRSNQALLLDAMLSEQENVSFDRSFTSWCKKLNSFSGVKPTDATKGFTGTLREYQKQGLGWLKFLQNFNLGGCLADDMGLGKTIQILAMLEQRRSRRLKKGEQRKPSIVVVPKSLVFNWKDEAERFTPKLRFLDYTGAERKKLALDKEDFDVLITTYGTLRNDIDRLREFDFDYAILDEAQAIKNPKSHAAKACRLLASDHRLAMTGTPVENRLGDLWSLFDFLNPGMLSTAAIKSFTSKENQTKNLKALSRGLQPFILRRTKKEVLTELPEKTEQILSCEMSPKQAKIYKGLREHYRVHLAKKVKEEGLEKSKIHVLEALLRLRQVACDPRLVDQESKVKGAKIEMLMEQLEELIAEGHKVLVFSQFTSLLGLVRNELKQAKVNFEYLDGQTRKRAECVKRFQETPDCPIFLISLKAGGHGLNLTAADYVFILDPWWNPAVEAQAIDRAHRMGQQNRVTAYKMISKDSVEDKILKLQQSKRNIADAVIRADEGLLKELSASDLQMLFT